MAINLANVNVSIQQFQSISTGKYNAGEVKLTSETTLGQVNNHVTFTGSNQTPLTASFMRRRIWTRGPFTHRNEREAARGEHGRLPSAYLA